MGVYDSRGNYSPTPGLCQQPRLPPDTTKPPAPIYSWENPPPTLVIRPKPQVNCLVGIRFCWDNGEYLAGCEWALTQQNGTVINGSLDGKSFLSQRTVGRTCQVQLEPQFDREKQITAVRAELQSILDEILATERQQADALKAAQDQRSALANVFYASMAFGEGFLYGAWGLIKSVNELNDLVNPFSILTTALNAAWTAEVTPEKGWIDAFLAQYDAAVHRDLAEALGFDPSTISREQIARAYEIANYIYEDEPTRQALARFARDYVKVQNHESILYFTGGMVFEIVFAALLVFLTGGAGSVARAGAVLQSLPLVEKLGKRLEPLGRNLKAARINEAGRVAQSGSGSQTIELPRAKAVRPARISKAPTAGVLKNADKAIIHPNKLILYALDPNHSDGGHKARVFESALGFTRANADLLMGQIREGLRTTGSTPGRIDQYGSRFTIDMWIKGPKGEGMVRTGWIYDPGSEVPRMTTIIVR